MAIAIKTKDDVRIFMGEQTTWGTALAASADFNLTTPEFGSQLSCEIVGIDWDTKVRTPNRSNTNGRAIDRLNIQHDTKGSSPKITINGDALYNDLAQFLYAVFQNVTEDAVASVFEKTFAFGATQPDFTAGAGWFGTIIVQDSTSTSVNKLLRDCICRKLTLTCDPESNQGRLQMSAEMISRGGATLNLAQVSGSQSQVAQEFYYFHDIKVFTGNGNALAPTSLKIEIENNARPVSVDGSTAGWFRSYALGPYSVKATFKVLYEANAQAIQALQATTIDHQWIVSWGTDNVDGYLQFVIQGQPGPAQDIDGETKEVEFVLTGVYNAGVAPITVVQADGVDRAW